MDPLNEHRKMRGMGQRASRTLLAQELYHLLQRLTVIAAAVDGVHTGKWVQASRPLPFRQVTLELYSQALTTPYIIP